MAGARGGEVDLTGTWRARLADEALRRSFAEPTTDDDGWEPVEVPGHWRSNPAFADTDGPLLYRRRFEARGPGAGSRSWLVLEGLHSLGDVWLDGTYLGDTAGYFSRHTFEVTDALRDRDEHTVAVEVACERLRERGAPPVLSHEVPPADAPDPTWNPGGIWRPVRVEHTGPVRARSLRVLCTEATAAQAVVTFRAELDSDATRSVRVRSHVGPAEDVADHPLAEGSNFVDWQVVVPEPRLWWPHALGAQALETVEVEVEVDGEPSHVLSRRIGLRALGWRRSTLSVNGEALFLKGSGAGPARLALGEATPEEIRADVDLALGAGLDLIRVHGRIDRPELYDAADEAGLLVWQDLPVKGGYGRGSRRKATKQISAAVDLLGHHPSVAFWCAGDRWAARAIAEADTSRPVVGHPGLLPQGAAGGAGSHLGFGWDHGHLRDLPRSLRAIPRLGRFVGRFGAQAVPSTTDFMEPERWPALDWERLEERFGLQRDLLERRVPSGDHPDLSSWATATQRYQAALVKHHVEHLRRLKYRPTGGFSYDLLADATPTVSSSLVDHRRVPKEGYAALREACRPVIVVADPLPAVVAPGAEIHLDVHVVSDRRERLAGCSVTARLGWPGGERVWHWEGDVGADSVAHVGTMTAMVPDVPGPLELHLELRAADLTASNRYRATIVS